MTADKLFCFVFCLILHAVTTVENEFSQSKGSLTIVVLSQLNPFHSLQARRLKDDILNQATTLNIVMPDVLLLHERWPAVGAWTVLPILSSLVVDHGSGVTAFVFCDEGVRLKLDRLVQQLGNYDFTKELFIGRALRDREATIIHHFAFHQNPSGFTYPDFATCFVISAPLVTSLVARLSKVPPKYDFTIDVQHELAMFVWDQGSGPALTDAAFLCGFIQADVEHCAAWRDQLIPGCNVPVREDDIYFAVKTCGKFHQDRVPILKSTWGGAAKHIEFFSDVSDATIPTVTLGLPKKKKVPTATLR